MIIANMLVGPGNPLRRYVIGLALARVDSEAQGGNGLDRACHELGRLQS